MTISYIIIGITVVVSFYAFRNDAKLRRWLFNPYVISTRGQYERFVLSGFIHRDHMHLILNMLVFYFFGPVVEATFIYYFEDLGGFYFVVLYLLAIIVADIPTYFKQRHNPGYNALGASGGVSAIVFAFILFHPVNDICLYFILCLPGFMLGTVYLVYSYFQGKRGNTGINHDAHLYGALFGLIFCAIMRPAVLTEFFLQLREWSFF